MSILALAMGLTIFALAQASPSSSASMAAGTVPAQSETMYHVQPYTNWLYVDTNSPNVSTNSPISHLWKQ